MKNMEIEPLSKLYVLDYTHEVYHDQNEPNRKFLETKLIGIFDSGENALTNFERYKNVKGFKDSVSGLKIKEYTIDSIYNGQISALLDEFPSPPSLSEVHSLYYVFEHPDGYEDINLLGLFTSEAAAQKAKQCLLCDALLEKFSDHISSFQHQINKLQWEEGFVKWEPTSKERTEWNLD